MKSKTTKKFRKALNALPKDIQQQARDAFELFKSDPFHNSLQFKVVDDDEDVWSVRIGLRYRALGIRDGDVIHWYWIGSHAEYDKLI